MTIHIFLVRPKQSSELVSVIPDPAIMPPSKTGWNLNETYDELHVYMAGYRSTYSTWTP